MSRLHDALQFIETFNPTYARRGARRSLMEKTRAYCVKFESDPQAWRGPPVLALEGVVITVDVHAPDAGGAILAAFKVLDELFVLGAVDRFRATEVAEIQAA